MNHLKNVYLPQNFPLIKSFYILLLFLPIIFTTEAQVVRVLDAGNDLPVSGVELKSISSEKFVLTNQQGKADISDLEDSISVHHPSYQSKSISRKEITSSGNIIFLELKTIEISEIVISANRWEQNPKEIPNQIVAIPKEASEFNNPQTAADLLESTGKIFVQKSQLGGGSPMIRGFGANAVLIVVDGIRMNNAIFRSGNLQNIINVDPNMMEGAEVIEGPGSVIYGSDALGGVMDFHTKEVEIGTEKGITGNTFFRYSTANKEKTSQVQWNLAGQKFGWFGGFTYSNFGDLRAGNNRPEKYPDLYKRNFYVERINGVDQIIQNDDPNMQVPSGYQTYNSIQKLKWRWKPDLSLEYIFNFSNTTDIPRYDRLAEEENGEPTSAEWYYGPQFWMMNAVKVKHDSSKIWDEMKLTLGWQQFIESRHDRKFQNPVRRSREEKVGMYSLNLDAFKSWNLTDIFYGLEFVYNDVSSSAFAQNLNNGEFSSATTRYPDGGANTKSFALYLNSKRKLFASRIFVNAGLRFNYYSLFALTTDEPLPFEKLTNENQALVGNLGLVWPANEKISWSVLGSSGFRAPNLDDMAKVFDSEPGNVIVPNPDLKPEYSYNLESTINWRPTQKASLKVTGFHSWLREAMVRTDFTFNGSDSIMYDGTLSKVQTLTNTGKAVVYGLNAEFIYQISDRWNFSSYINWMKGEDLITGESLRHVTPAFGLTSIRYQHEKLKVEFYSRYNGAIPFEELPPSEQNKPNLYTSEGSLAWYTLNIRTEYRFSHTFSMNASMENILDKHYCTYSSGISAPGINGILALRIHF